MRPHNLPFMMLGAGLLWFGWFGFNAGSAMSVERYRRLRHSSPRHRDRGRDARLAVSPNASGTARRTSLGAASGIVAGLVAITPSCSSVNILGALSSVRLAGVLCALAVGLKYNFGYDDSLDVVGVHLVGGIVGTLSDRILGRAGVTIAGSSGAIGLFYGGGWQSTG